MYHCVEFGAVRVVILKVLHSFLNLCNTSEILVQSPRRPETQKSKNYDTSDVFCIWSKSTNTSQKATAAPLSDDPVRVFGHVVVTDDVIHAGQSLVHVLLQTLQVLRLFVHWDDGVLQLHQATLERGQDGHLQGRENDFKNVKNIFHNQRDYSHALYLISGFSTLIKKMTDLCNGNANVPSIPSLGFSNLVSWIQTYCRHLNLSNLD